MSRLELVFYGGSVAHAPGETVLLLIPEDERPLQGHAGWIDWRLGGVVSQHLLTDFINGGSEDAALLTAGVPLRATRLLALGVGPSSSLTGETLAAALAGATCRLLALNASEVLLALPAAIDLEREAETLLRGLLRGLAERVDAAGLRLVIPDADRHEVALKAAVEHLLPHAHRADITVDVQSARPEVDAALAERDSSRH